MKLLRAFVLLAGLSLVTVVLAQEKKTPAPPAPPEPAAPVVRLVGVDELDLEAGKSIEVPDTLSLIPTAGAPAATHFLVAKLWREIPAKATPAVKDLDVKLAIGGTSLAPYAVAVIKKELADEKGYVASDKKRGVTELCWFAVNPGSRDGEVVVDGKSAGKTLPFFATLVIYNDEDAEARLTLPDDSKQVLGRWQRVTITVPTGARKMELEVRGVGKVKFPFTKFDKGETKFLAIVADKDAPAVPDEFLKKAIPKIDRAYKMFAKQTGVGGGTYNIGTADNPVHVQITFGHDNVNGKISQCECDRIIVDFNDAGEKIKYAWRDTYWNVIPYDKAKIVEVTDDARRVTGEIHSGRFIVRAPKGKPAVFDDDGLLQKGVVYDDKAGSFECEASKEGKTVLVFGDKVKDEPPSKTTKGK